MPVIWVPAWFTSRGQRFISLVKIVQSLSEKRGHPLKKGLKSTWIGIGVSLLLAILKGAAGVLGNSFALVADAIESLGDIFTAAIMLVGLRTAIKPPDEDHQYGHGKAEPMAALFVVLALLIAAIFIGVKAVFQIQTPHPVPEPFTLIVLVVVVAVKILLSRYVSGVNTAVESEALKADAFHHLSDAITSAAAFIGISIALIGGKDYAVADDWAALLAAFIIAFNAYRIGKPAFAQLMDKKPDLDWLEKVETVALSFPKAKSIEKLRVKKSGLDIYLDFHLRVPGKLTVSEGHEVSHKVKDQLMKLHPNLRDVLIHTEPENQGDSF
jgi:cation diffusion facilitator family transporter